MRNLAEKEPRRQSKTVAPVRMEAVDSLSERGGLHAICIGSACPNIDRCYSRKRSAFMILGSRCTRECSFCNAVEGVPLPPDPDEPRRVAEAVRQKGLLHVIVTSPTRDDLPDGGAEQFARTVEAIKAVDAGIVVELLIPDMREDETALSTIASSGADIIGHNLETVPRLYHLRKGARYERSLRVLRKVKAFNPAVQTKSGIMLGLGERIEEVLGVMRDLLEVECHALSIGQYVSPSNLHQAVSEYVEYSYFDFFRKEGERMGFRHMRSSPYTRRSFMLEGVLQEG